MFDSLDKHTAVRTIWLLAIALVAYLLGRLIVDQNDPSFSKYTLIVATPLLLLWQFLFLRERRKHAPGTGIRFMLLLAILLRLLSFALFDATSTSDDIYRYVFEGHSVVDGGNPYRFAPASSRWDELTTKKGLEEIRAGINNPSIATIYPPVAEMLFALGTFLHPGLWGWRSIVLLFDLALLLILPALLKLYGKDPRWSVLYAWSPLVLFEGTGAGHVDLVAVALLMFAFFAQKKSRLQTACLLLMASILVKIISILAIPFFLRQCRLWQLLLTLTIATLILALPYAKSRAQLPDFGTWQIIAGTATGQSFEVRDSAAAEKNWKIVQAQNLNLPSPFDWNALSATSLIPQISDILDHPENGGRTTRIIRSPSNERLVFQRLETNEFASFAVALKRPFRAVEDLPFNDIIGQYRFMALPESSARHLDGAVLRLDGQGRFTGDIVGRYWISDNALVLQTTKKESLGSFRMSKDLEFGQDSQPSARAFLIKHDEKPWMGLRHYGERWTANAPIFAWLEELMPAPKKFDLQRKQAQKVVALVLLFFGGLLFWRRMPGPQACALLFVCLWATAPALYPWYLLWVLVTALFAPSWAGLLFANAALLLHFGAGFVPVVFFLLVMGIMVDRRHRQRHLSLPA